MASKKSMIALSSQGKIFGLSSYDGTLQWTSNLMEGTKKMFIRKSVKREDEYISSQIVSVSSDAITFLNEDGGHLFTQKLEKKADQFMLINLKSTKNQFIMAIDHHDPSEVSVYPKSEIPKELDLAAENIFFTCIDKETGVLSGYQVIDGWKTVKLWQLNVVANTGDKIHQIRSQH